MKDILKHIKGDIDELKDISSTIYLEREISLKENIAKIEDTVDDLIFSIYSMDRIEEYKKTLESEGLTKPVAMYGIDYGYDDLATSEVSLQSFIDGYCSKEDTEVHLQNIFIDSAKKLYEFIKNLIVKIGSMMVNAFKEVYNLLANIIKTSSLLSGSSKKTYEEFLENMQKQKDKDRKFSEEMKKQAADKQELLKKEDDIKDILNRLRDEWLERLELARQLMLPEQIKLRIKLNYGSVNYANRLKNFFEVTSADTIEFDSDYMSDPFIINYYSKLGYKDIVKQCPSFNIDPLDINNIDIAEMFKKSEVKPTDTADLIPPSEWLKVPEYISKVIRQPNYSGVINKVKHCLDITKKKQEKHKQEDIESLNKLNKKYTSLSNSKNKEDIKNASEVLMEMKALQKLITIRSKFYSILLRDGAELSLVSKRIITWIETLKFKNCVGGVPKRADAETEYKKINN